MPPIIHLMRHGQGYHSSAVTPKDGNLIPDPSLTPHGFEQAAARGASFSRHDKIDLLVASPLRRTIQTCATAFKPVIEQHGLKILLVPAAEEVSDEPMDCPSGTETLRREFGEDLLDLSLLEDDSAFTDDGKPSTATKAPSSGPSEPPSSSRHDSAAPSPSPPAATATSNWRTHAGAYSAAPPAVHVRAQKLRRWLRARPEKEIALVTHGYFAHYLTSEVDAAGNQTTGWWEEAELRTYRFAEDGKDGEADVAARLVETEESRKGREV